MEGTVPLLKSNGKYLWFALLGLGFQPDAATSLVTGRANVKQLNFGTTMFEKPNKDAFHIVIHFLLNKLNPTRFQEVYRHCWPVLNHKADAEFRKVTCAWLREIMDENGSAGSKVVASLFLSPGGPKFINVMLQLANHVMLQEMKTFTTNGSWVPETAATSVSKDMLWKRTKLMRTRFLKVAVDQDNLLQEYQRRAQSLVKSSKDIRAEGAKYDDLLKCHISNGAQDGASQAQKIQKVRYLWSVFDGMLSTIKEEQKVVDCVVNGEVDQHTLDGTDLVLKIPQTLLERIEQLPQHLSAGNVYEAGQLNLLSVLELMNHALLLLKEEQSRLPEACAPQLHPQHLQEKCLHMARGLKGLQLMRQKISKEEIPEVRGAIRKLEAEWDRKWMDTLKDTPLISFLNEDPALGFLSPMAPLSFEPATEAIYTSSVFSQYRAKLLEEKPAETKSQDGDTSYSKLKSFCLPTDEKMETPVATTKASSRADTSLHGLLDTQSSPVSTPPPKPHQASMRKTTHSHPRPVTMRTKAQILDREYDNLANQFADAVTANSPMDGRIKGLELEDLLSTLGGDPFSTRKQLPRTPESLILDVKNSWRKAIEEDKAQKTHLSAKSDVDSIIECLTPLADVSLRPSAPSQSVSSDPTSAAHHSSPPVCQQGESHMSTLSWDCSNTEAPHSPSGTGSSAFHFSLHHETLPEMPGSDSLLSLSEEAADPSEEEEEEEDELLLPGIPSLKSETKQTLLTARQRLEQIQQACSDSSFMDNRKRSPDCLLSRHEAPSLDRNWLMAATMDAATSVAATEKVFSLDLDTLESPSPPNKQEYSLPKLVTFSPIDDM
ncbi:HAUS augmin-like complex subunit 6 isoform X2 [Myripristis murdjan]|uniref:HAUS augmin-like complex subunit 6 isoform X2 n=1 Tax=Myripristis murdjan TaxID=586833 RepID=UPI001175F251|nr:HAUS augmin-like complex subunit 6 isoform X2 [Myripristis murdjan]